jgi:hypothetical protein
MGKRSRKGRPAGEAPQRPAAYARAEERNAAARASLTPLAPGEHPGPLKAAIAVAVLIAASNLVLWAVGWEVQGQDPGLAQAAPLAAVMLLAAWGMWRHRGWAVLGFMAFLGITMVFAAGGLVLSSNLEAAGLSLVVLLLCGWLFYKLVRVLGRVQMPRPPG